jgi:hypothetical protein
LGNQLILLIVPKKSYDQVSQRKSAKSKKVMEEMKAGQLISGRSEKKATKRKQAIAIGLSEAR